MCACMFVCVYACVYVYMCVCMHVDIFLTRPFMLAADTQ